MSDLIMPVGGPRFAPRAPDQVNAYVRAVYEKSVATWGIPNNLIRTMACSPQLALTEVDYANSFIFDEGTYITWPRPGGEGTVLFPAAGFIDRVTKELVINLISLLNRSRYSITHHTVIGWSTLLAGISGDSDQERRQKAEAMLLNLVEHAGRANFENKRFRDAPLYTEFQLACMRLAVKIRDSSHSITDEDLRQMAAIAKREAAARIAASPLATQFPGGAPDDAYMDMFVDGMLVELTWCIVHFNGLLNHWFTVLRVRDEENAERDGIDFVSVYNSVVPESIKVRNNNLLGKSGWGHS